MLYRKIKIWKSDFVRGALGMCVAFWLLTLNGCRPVKDEAQDAPPRAAAPAREEAIAPPEAQMPRTAEHADDPGMGEDDAAANETAPEAFGWNALRENFRFAQCEPAIVKHWVKRYARSKTYLTSLFEQATPYLPMVNDALSANGLPAEFAFLPMVESEYRAHSPRNRNLPAGMWQLMPATARNLGVRVEKSYDGRLNAYASTVAAAKLLRHLGDQFSDDWIATTMAYNAGEFRVKKAIARTKKSLSVYGDYRSLPVSRITHDHVAKLNALACIVRAPAQYGIELPAFAPRLVNVALRENMDVRLAARLAGATIGEFKRLNPDQKSQSMEAPVDVVMPEKNRARFVAIADRLTPGKGTGWRERNSAVTEADWKTLARQSAVSPDLLREINAEAGAPILSRGQTSAPRAEPSSKRSPLTYRVKSGDSLWKIAKRYGLSIKQLCQWNDIALNHLLKPGQVIHLRWLE